MNRREMFKACAVAVSGVVAAPSLDQSNVLPTVGLDMATGTDQTVKIVIDVDGRAIAEAVCRHLPRLVK